MSTNDNPVVDGAYGQLRLDLADALRRAYAAGLGDQVIGSLVDALKAEIDERRYGRDNPAGPNWYDLLGSAGVA